MPASKSAWASIVCALCCLGVSLLSMFAMVGTILGVSVYSISNVMMALSYALLAFAHFRYWRSQHKTKVNGVVLALATLTVAGVSLWHLMM